MDRQDVQDLSSRNPGNHAYPCLSPSPLILRRLAKFSLVGGLGILVQGATLALLLRVAGLNYLLATALAVETALLHNFAWHRRWTWPDRPRSSIAITLLRFNATNGAASLIGNLLVMFVLVGVLKINPYAANLITIGICSIVNFALADRFVFVQPQKVAQAVSLRDLRD